MAQTKIYRDHVAVLDCDLCKECMDKLDKLIREFVHFDNHKKENQT